MGYALAYAGGGFRKSAKSVKNSFSCRIHSTGFNSSCVSALSGFLSFSSYPVIEKSPVGIFDETLNKLPFSYGQVRLNRPIIVETYLSGRFFIISNQRFNVHAYGQTLKEARTNFFESFEELHDLYISSDKDELTGDAIELKELFDNLIKK